MIALVRLPYLSRYNLLDVREEPIVSSAAGYLHGVGAPFTVFDFHLDRTVTVDSLLACPAKVVVLCVRGTGLHWKYAERVALHLLAATSAQIVIYGQTGKLAAWQNPDPARVRIVPHDEVALARALGLPEDGARFDGALRHYPYGLQLLDAMGPRASLFKATFETTRGCHYGCKFCFINHGVNYPERFARRPNAAVIADMRQYVERGQRHFWFYDSEFIGGDQSHMPQIIALLETIRDEFKGGVEIMLYSRANTLERFGRYDLLREAGVNSILIGVESFAVTDLKAMRKGQIAEKSLETIRALRDNGIFCNLSFILFNKTATLSTIRQNLALFSSLYRDDNFIFIGQTLYFGYAFESDWASGGASRKLSGKTRLAGSTSSTRSPNLGVSFDPDLEPLAEIYRILNYEHVRKLSDLNLLKETAPDRAPREQIHRWATLLPLFTLNLMQTAADEFGSGELRLDTAADYEDWIYASFREFNHSLLPAHLAATVTDVDGYPAGDWNGWEEAIPTPTQSTEIGNYVTA